MIVIIIAVLLGAIILGLRISHVSRGGNQPFGMWLRSFVPNLSRGGGHDTANNAAHGDHGSHGGSSVPWYLGIGTIGILLLLGTYWLFMHVFSVSGPSASRKIPVAAAGAVNSSNPFSVCRQAQVVVTLPSDSGKKIDVDPACQAVTYPGLEYGVYKIHCQTLDFKPADYPSDVPKDQNPCDTYRQLWFTADQPVTIRVSFVQIKN